MKGKQKRKTGDRRYQELKNNQDETIFKTKENIYIFLQKGVDILVYLFIMYSYK